MERTGGLQLCECGLLRAWHGHTLPAYYGGERFEAFTTLEKSRGCEGFKARKDQTLRFTQKRGKE